jgi:hypothetical protein
VLRQLHQRNRAVLPLPAGASSVHLLQLHLTRPRCGGGEQVSGAARRTARGE